MQSRSEHWRLVALSIVTLLAGLCALPALAGSSPFVRPPELENDVAFWRRVYTEVGTNGGLIHDNERLNIVYEVVDLPQDMPPAARSRRIDNAKGKYESILRKLGSAGDDETLTGEEQRVRDLWPENTSRTAFAAAAQRVRFQLGQANRFREGLVRSGAWMPHIVSTLERKGLPTELAALPHVESSFNTYAYSKVGAAGMWQFMRSTGRRFLRIDNTVDERLDPYKATEAAASFLQQNYAVLDSWPLALTAYNHGAAGMRRAKEKMGTDDIVTIVRKYESKTFGFASRNFYVAFLAALEIDAEPERFFPGIRRDAVDSSQVVVLPDYVAMPGLVKALDVDSDLMRRLNPSLLPAVWNGSRRAPRGYELRVPPHLDMTAALARLPAADRHQGQILESQHRVRSGQTLSSIAAEHGISMTRLAELNGLRKPYQIRAGQVLDLPDSAPAKVAAARTPEPAAASQPVKEPVALASAESRYVVRPGDTLGKIATRHGMTEDELMTLNRIRNRNFIYQGQELAITAAAAESKAPEPPVEVPEAVIAEAAEETVQIAAAETAEPESQSEAEALGPTLVPGIQAAVSADPADYSVLKGEMIRVEAAETLGHYADWLQVSASRLRQINRMSHATPVVIGRKLKLDFAKVNAGDFEAKRQAYHRELQESFFTEFRIAGSEKHVVRSGESIWILAQKKYNVPLWLLRQYNPDVDFATVRPGTELVIPRLEAAGNGAAPT